MRKRLCAFLACMFACALILPAGLVMAAEPEEPEELVTPDGFKYTVTDGEATITGYEGTDTDLVIPGDIGGVPVTQVGEMAFKGNAFIETVTVPNGVTQLRSEAFRGCSNLTSIEIPYGVTQISDGLFRSCWSLTSVNIPDSVYRVGYRAFESCTGLTSIVIPSSVHLIDNYTFLSCTHLTSAKILGNPYSLGLNMFDNCVRLTSVELPDNITNIPSDTFRQCSSLTTIHIPESVVQINERAFTDCKSLTSIVIPDKVSAIRENAFRGCTSLAFMAIPARVTTLGTGVLSGCDNLGTIVFGGSASEWIAASADASVPSDTRIWCTGGTGEVLGPIDDTIDITPDSASDTSDLKGGSTLQFTVSCDIIPDGVYVPVQLKAEGMTLDTDTITLTGGSTARAADAVVTGTVTAGAGETVSLSVASMGGQAYTGPEWSAVLPDAPAVTLTSSTSTLQPGGTVMLTVTGSNIPASGTIIGTLTLTSMTSNGAASVPVSLSASNPTQQVSCVVNSDAVSAGATVSGLACGDLAVTPPAPLTLTVSQPAPPPIPTLTPTPTPTSTPTATATPTETITPSPSPDAPATGTPEPSAAPSASPGGSAAAPPIPGVSASAEPSESAKPSEEPSDTPEASAAPSASQVPGPVILMPSAPGGLSVVTNPDGGSSIVGAQIESLWTGTTAGQFAGWIERDRAESVRLVTAEGITVPETQQVATGMRVEVVSGDGTVLRASEIAVRGDVLGTGQISLSQVVAMANAYVGRRPLEGVYATAGDLNGTGEIELSDLVEEAQLYVGSSFDVDCVVADTDTEEILQESGYDMVPWTDSIAVLTAGIPETVRVRSVAWTQHDTFPGGYEQTLYYEGPEEALVFGTYTEGHTQITTVVTTDAGRQATHVTEIDWSDDIASDAPAARAALRSAKASESARATAKPSGSASPKPAQTAALAPSAVDLLNTFRAEVLDGTNKLRTDNKVSPKLIQSTRLSQAAMVRAEEMASAGVLSHTRPDGSGYDTVAELGKGLVLGENIHSNKGYPTLQIAQVATRSWANSAPHRRNILEKRYTHTGMGFVQADNGRWYCVQMFSNGNRVLAIDEPKA